MHVPCDIKRKQVSSTICLTRYFRIFIANRYSNYRYCRTLLINIAFQKASCYCSGATAKQNTKMVVECRPPCRIALVRQTWHWSLPEERSDSPAEWFKLNCVLLVSLHLLYDASFSQYVLRFVVPFPILQLVCS